MTTKVAQTSVCDSLCNQNHRLKSMLLSRRWIRTGRRRRLGSGLRCAFGRLRVCPLILNRGRVSSIQTLAQTFDLYVGSSDRLLELCAAGSKLGQLSSYSLLFAFQLAAALLAQVFRMRRAIAGN